MTHDESTCPVCYLPPSLQAAWDRGVAAAQSAAALSKES